MNDFPWRRPSKAIIEIPGARPIAGAVALAVAFALGACHPRGAVTTPPPPPHGGGEAQEALGPAQALRSDVDLDGDGARDELLTRFTGGAHCCYRIGARFAATGEELWLPFNLDGGYGPGAGLGSDPARFDIVEQDGGPVELVMEIETYNGEPQPLPEEWERTYGIRSHRVMVSFTGRQPTLRNLHDVVPPDPPAE